MATIRTRSSKYTKAGISDNGFSRLNALIRNRCALQPHELAKALMVSANNLKRYCNAPFTYFTINQLILLSYYLNIEFRELMECIGGEQFSLDIPPTFFAAVQKRNLKVNGECVGNMLPPAKDETNSNWFDR